jgi:RNase P subunit RPR2
VSKEDYDIEIDGEKQLFICKKCENISMTIAHLSVHLERKHGITTGTYVCDICGRQCNSQENLRNHIRYVNILDHIFFLGGGGGMGAV